jgi:hypothetical protein
MAYNSENICKKDVNILRNLASQVAELADLPLMAEKRAFWVKHNQLEPVRPLILVFPEGAWRELLPDSTLECESDVARKWEWNLRSRLYTYYNFRDDTVLENTLIISKHIQSSDWGIQPKHSNRTQESGSWKFIPVIQEFSDFKKLHYPEISYDEDGTLQEIEETQRIFGNILDIQLKGIAHLSFHLAAIYSDLRGLEQTYIDMTECPDEMLSVLEFFTQGYENLVQQYIELNLLSINNDATYHSSGGVGYTNELPASGFKPERVRPVDMWASAESQEWHVVSPRMHRQFALDYEKRLLSPFGLNGYGCCEDLTKKLDDVFTIPKIRRISISPFADVERCAEKIGNKFIFSWKPQPQHLVGYFDVQMVTNYINNTLQIAKQNHCVLELILKDTHTCENQPDRFTKWTEISKKLIENF